MSDQALRRLPIPTLCLVTDLSVFDHNVSSLVDAVSSAVDNGVNMVQIRDPELDEDDFRFLVHNIAVSVSDRAIIIVNPSRRRIPLIEGVDGVQLAENASMTVPEVRAIFGSASLVGRSVHSMEGALSATAAGADFLVLGTIFPSASHPGGDWHGTDIIGEVVRETHLPVIGIGGITAANVAGLMSTGACGVAVVRSILGSSDPGAAASELRQALDAVIG